MVIKWAIICLINSAIEYYKHMHISLCTSNVFVIPITQVDMVLSLHCTHIGYILISFYGKGNFKIIFVFFHDLGGLGHL